MRDTHFLLSYFGVPAPPASPSLELTPAEAKEVVEKKDDLRVYFAALLRLGDYVIRDLDRLEAWYRALGVWWKRMYVVAGVLVLGNGFFSYLAFAVPGFPFSVALGFTILTAGACLVAVGLVFRGRRRARRNEWLARGIRDLTKAELDVAKSVTETYEPHEIPQEVVERIWDQIPSLKAWRLVRQKGKADDTSS